MKNRKIVLVATWDGWCGACAVERPLVLTRSGRLGLRTWLTAPVVETRPLTLTCRLCGNSDVVPTEADDPPVLVTSDDAEALVLTTAPPVTAALTGGTTPIVPVAAPLAGAPLEVPTQPAAETGPSAVPASAATAPLHRDPALDRARSALGGTLSALLAARTAQAGHVRLTPALTPDGSASRAPAPALPLQRSAPDAEALATLQLLADGLDLLSSSRS